MKEILELVVNKNDLDVKSAERAMELIMSGEATPVQIGAFLVALRIKGEKINEIAAFAKIMRKFCNQISPKIPKNEVLIDTCGTGGDKANTFNISTITALILAGADLHVAKHGNRSVSSKCGSADLLEGFGVNITTSPEIVKKCIEEAGIGFMFAPVFHPAMRYALPPRRELGLRTVFNILGPLTNPANAQRQILGVYSPNLTEKLANTLNLLEVERALTFHGHPGIDEISNVGSTVVSELKDGKIKNYKMTVEDFGIKSASIKDIEGGPLEINIGITLNILNGQQSPKSDIVLINTAAGLYVGGKVDTIKDGVDKALEIIISGKPIEKLKKLVEVSGGNLEKFEALEEQM